MKSLLGLVLLLWAPAASAQNTVSEEFSVLTYNVMMLDKKIFPNHRQNTRAEIIPGAIERNGQWDVVVFNEAFWNTARDILTRGMHQKGYIYQTAVPSKNAINDDGGVFIVSRHRITESDTYVYNHCHRADCIASKGISYAQIRKGNSAFHVFATHLQAGNDVFATHLRAGNDDLPSVARERQVVELADYIRRKTERSASVSGGEYAIVAGDLNIDPVINRDEFLTMKRRLPVTFPAGSTSNYTFDAGANDLAGWRYAGEEPAVLDYVLPVSTKSPPTTVSYRLVKPTVARLEVAIGNRSFADLSDHYALSATFRYTRARQGAGSTAYDAVERGRRKQPTGNSSISSQFVRTPNAGIPGFNKETVERVLAEDCLKRCVGRAWCKSVDYQLVVDNLPVGVAIQYGLPFGRCFLQPVNKFEQSLKTDYPGNPYDHYHRK